MMKKESGRGKLGRGRRKEAGKTSLQNSTIKSRGKKYLEIFLLLITPNVCYRV